GEKLFHRVENFEVRGVACRITEVDETHCLLVRAHGTLALAFRGGEPVEADDRRRHLSEGIRDVLFVPESRLLELCDRNSALIAQAASVEDRSQHAGADRPRGTMTDEVRKFGTLPTEKAGERERWVERGLG